MEDQLAHLFVVVGSRIPPETNQRRVLDYRIRLVRIVYEVVPTNINERARGRVFASDNLVDSLDNRTLDLLAGLGEIIIHVKSRSWFVEIWKC